MPSKKNILLESLMDHKWDPDRDGVRLNNLLDYIRNNRAIDDLKLLIDSNDESLVRASAWLASELGSECCSIFDKLADLIDSEDAKVRFNIIDCVLLCASKNHSIALKKTLMLLQDEVASVRWKVLDFITKMSSPQISALNEELFLDCDNNFLEGLNFLIKSDSENFCFEVIKRHLNSGSDILGKFSVAVAIRENCTRKSLIELYEFSENEEIKDFLYDYIT